MRLGLTLSVLRTARALQQLTRHGSRPALRRARSREERRPRGTTAVLPSHGTEVGLPSIVLEWSRGALSRCR